MVQRRLVAEARHERILSAVRRDGVVSVAVLAEELQVALMTVRRDVNHLADLGLLRRVHGGAAAMDRRRETNGMKGVTIGMVVPLVDHYWSVISYRAQAEASAGGARFVLRDSGPGGRDSLALAKAIVGDLRADGLILAPPISEPDRSTLTEWLAGIGVCTVFVERSSNVALPQVQTVGTDHRLGAAMAVQHLFRLGHRRIGLMRPLATAGADEVEDGWRAAMAVLGLPQENLWDSVSATHPSRPRLIAEGLEDLQRRRTTALLVSGDAYAMALLQACDDHGIEIPRSLSIVAYGDDVAALSHPPLTAVRPPREQVGRTAVRMLGEHLRGGAEHRPWHVRIAPTLVERGTTAAVEDSS